MVYQMRAAGSWMRARLQQLVLPTSCVACGSPGESMRLDLCASCAAELPINLQACRHCGIPLTSHDAHNADICGACLRRPPPYALSFCAYRYAYPIEHFVHALKYGHVLAQARVLGELLAEYLSQRRQDAWPTYFMPVPLATARFRERGYNQALELGRFVERALNLPMRTDVLVRDRHTAAQVGLSRRERRKNLRGAFAVLKLPSKHVAILDDVVTTGSTVNEVARTLRRAGAERVEVWAVARATLK